MTALWIAADAAFLLFIPFVLVGVINRTKAIWAGRKGPRILQSLHDLTRLLRKRSVYSAVTTAVFRTAPLVALATVAVSGLVVPLLGSHPPLAFRYDFVALAYLWGLGRIALMLGALDTGSPFEGMGASREATFGALVEPALFLLLGALAAASGHDSLAELLRLGMRSPAEATLTLAAVAALVVILQVEGARVPVDDPSTHLELTMVHEVMILDHSGPDLAALEYAAAMKLTLCAALIATLLNPFAQGGGWIAAAINVALTLAVGVVIGFVESLVARLQLRAVPQYVAVAVVAGFTALLALAWRQGSVG